MKRFFACRLICACALLVLGMSGCADADAGKEDYTVRVLLPQGEGYDFLGSQLVVDGEGVGELTDSRVLDVTAGQSVRFAIKPHELMIIECTGENVSYADGFITVENVRTPTTVDVTAKVGTTYVYNYNVNKKSGGVTSSVPSGSFVLEGDEITLTAEVGEGETFLGYSTGNYISSGGKLLCEDTTYTFNIKSPTTLFANYKNYSHWTVNYYANGGKTAGKSGDVPITDEYEDSFYYCPNSRPDKGYFTRDGYVLTGYNTKPDGSGDYYGLGWNIIMPESGEVDLYCVWAKAADAADFTYKNQGSGVSITGYSGDADYVVIPEVIDGKKVKLIAQNAFVDASFTEVYIPKTVTTVSNRAFVNCDKLVKVNLSDSVVSITDSSFYECDAMKTLAVQATHYPKVPSTINFTHQINYERLITRKNDIMLIVSGSTNIYGLTARKLEAALDNEWDVITYATVASTPNTFYAEVGLNYLDEDDILIFAPEASPDGHQWGTDYWKDIVWQINEGSYDAISLVDISNYTRVFSSFAAYNQTRSKLAEKTYEVHLADFNEYGEHVTYHSTGNISSPWIKWDIAKFFTDKNVANLNRVLDAASEKGVPALIGWMACTTKQNLLAEAKNRDNQIKYMELAAKLYHAHFFADLADYIYEPKYVYDSAMHITTEGCVLRTQQMITDITAVLKELKLYDEE